MTDSTKPLCVFVHERKVCGLPWEESAHQPNFETYWHPYTPPAEGARPHSTNWINFQLAHGPSQQRLTLAR